MNTENKSTEETKETTVPMEVQAVSSEAGVPAGKRVRLPGKAPSNAKLHGLSGPQKELLEQWLFSENLGYKQVAELCQREFGRAVDPATVGRYFQRERARWDLEHKAEARLQVVEAGSGGLDAETRYRMMLEKMINVVLCVLDAATTPEERRVATDYAKVLISARRESHEALRAVAG